MFKANSGRSAFLLVILMALVFGTVLISNTFASQVDYSDEAVTLENGTNGMDYSVDLKYSRGASDYNSMLNQNAAALTADMLWCPGKTEIVYLKLENREKFPVDCTLSLNITNNGFDDMLTYAVIDGLQPTSADHPNNWTEFKNKAGTSAVLKGNPELFTRLPLEAGSGDRYLALAIHMDEKASDAYQNKTMNMQFVLQVDAYYEPGEVLTKTN